MREPTISYVVARLERAVRRGIDARVGPHGLTTGQYTALSVLAENERLSNAQLARRSYMTPQSAGEVVAALEGKGFVRRTADPAHGRILRVQVTAAGRRVLVRCDAAVAEMEEQMLRDLSPRQRTALRGGLVAAVRALGAGLAA